MNSSSSKAIPILGIILGIVIIVVTFASSEFNYSFYGKVSEEEYGGDAYTGIQNAGAQVANNTYYMYNMVQDGFRILLIAIGSLTILHYAGKLAERRED